MSNKMSQEAENTIPEYRCAAIIRRKRCNEPLSGKIHYSNDHGWVPPQEYIDARKRINKEDSKETS